MEQDTVLFVDDEENVLNSIRRIVADQPYQSLFAVGGHAALELLAVNSVRVVVVDMRMPEMSGHDLLCVVRNKYPEVVRIVLSGYAQAATMDEELDANGIFMYIMKPWQSEHELLSAITLGLKYAHSNENPA